MVKIKTDEDKLLAAALAVTSKDYTSAIGIEQTIAEL